MTTIKQQIILFRKTRQCVWTTVIFALISLGYIPYKVLRLYMAGRTVFDVFCGLSWSLHWQLYGFIIFLFVTYEFMALPRTSGVSETLSCVMVPKWKQEIAQMTVLLLIPLFLFVLHIIENFFLAGITGNMTPEYLIYVGKVLFIYFLGVNVLAVLSGWVVSFIRQRTVAYLVLVCIGFYATLRCQQIFIPEDQIGTLGDLTQFFCVGANWTVNHGYLYPVEQHFWSKMLFHILFICLIAVVLYFYRMQKKKILLLAGADILCLAGLFVMWNHNVSGSYQGYADGQDLLYVTEVPEENASKFYVERYDIHLQVDNDMTAEVKMELSDGNLPVYDFTLLSCYDIIDITDLSGIKLTYDFSNNYLAVHNDGGSLEGVIIRYRGRGTNHYFAGHQGICLPGNVPFYPLAGWRIFESLGQCELEQRESEFLVTVDYDGNIFSNLSETAKHTFSGYSNNLTLMAGFWEEKEINGITYLYPKYSASLHPGRNEYLRQGIEDYFAVSSEAGSYYTIQDKKIIIAPYEFEGGNYMFGTDALMIGSIQDLDDYYMNYCQTGEWYKEMGMNMDEYLEKWNQGRD